MERQVAHSLGEPAEAFLLSNRIRWPLAPGSFAPRRHPRRHGVETRTDHPHIVKVPDICGGAATVWGTRVPVWVLAEYARAGHTPQELQDFYPHLTLAHIYDALSYWQDHPEEIEAEIRQNQGP